VSDHRYEVGSLGEEAAKLFAALQGWSREKGGEYADAAAGAASGFADVVDSVNEHVATDSADCKYCPLCRAISVVRGISPEVKDHLTSAASSLMQAAEAAMATDAAPHGRPRAGPSGDADEPRPE